MESQSLFIQSNVGSRLEIPFEREKNKDSEQSRLSKSFKTSLSEGIVDVYERSEINTAVPDERSGFDRRISNRRSKSSAQSVPFASGTINTEVSLDSTKQIYIRTEKNTSEFSSLFQESKGGLLDTWA